MLRIPEEFIEKCVEAFDSNELIKLLEKGGPAPKIVSILDFEVQEAYRALDEEGKSKWGVEVAADRARLAAQFKRLVNRLPS